MGKIDGDSMAPTLKGEHELATCSKCNYPYNIGMIASAGADKVCCPLCGQVDDRGAVTSKQSAEAVQIEKLIKDTNINRWDVIAYQNDEHTSVKRVVGLPFEKVRFQNGDVVVNGFKYAKTPEVQLATRILLFDSQYLQTGQLKYASADSTPTFPVSLANEEIQIDYSASQNFLAMQKDDSGRIKDFYGYNQSLSRELNECHDFGMELDFEELDPAVKDGFEIRAVMRTPIYGEIAIGMDVSEKIMVPLVFQNGNRILGGRNVFEESELKVFFSVIDGRARILFGKNKDKSVVLDELESPWKKIDPPVQFRTLKTGPGKLTRMKIYRDLHYFEKVNLEATATGKDQFFVLGDNVPVSKDSRQGGNRPNRSQIIGIVK